MRLLTEEPIWISEPLGQQRLRLEVYHSGGTEVAARNLPENFVTLQASGSARIEVEDGRCMRPHLIAAGGFCVSPAGPSARARWNAHRKLFVVALAPDWLATLTDQQGRQIELRRAVGARDTHIEWLLRALVHESKHDHPAGTAYLDALAHALALRILGLHSAQPVPSNHRGGLTGTRLRTVLDRMHADLARPATTTELASLAGLSIDHFVRAFRVSMGEPPHRYLLRERIREAQQLLATTSRPLVEIALQTGFADQSHFHSAFRRWVGTTPSCYRAEN
jgi:AraC family transcriptional regulator